MVYARCGNVGTSGVIFLIDYRKAQHDSDYDKVSELLTVSTVNRYDYIMDIRREIAFHRDTGECISHTVAQDMLLHVTKYGHTYDIKYLANTLYVIEKKVIIPSLTIRVSPKTYLDVYFSRMDILDYLCVNECDIPEDMTSIVEGDSLQILEAEAAFENLKKRMLKIYLQ